MEELGLYGRKTGVTLKTTLGKNPEEWFESDADEVKESTLSEFVIQLTLWHCRPRSSETE